MKFIVLICVFGDEEGKGKTVCVMCQIVVLDFTFLSKKPTKANHPELFPGGRHGRFTLAAVLQLEHNRDSPASQDDVERKGNKMQNLRTKPSLNIVILFRV